MNEEVISRLTGVLQFDVKLGPLLAFEAMLKRTQALMVNMMKTADDLNKRLDKKFDIAAKRQAKTTADVAAERSLFKQLATEQKLSRLRYSQFRAQLAEQKLVANGKREDSFLQSAALRQQVTAAVLSAKQHKAEQESLKVDLGRAKLQASAEQSRVREARLADILQRRQERTVQLQQQAALHQSKLQRAEAGLLAARERGIRLAERHQQSKLAAAARESRAQVSQDMKAKRFDFAAERHASWQAKQAEPQGMGLGGFTVGLGTAGAALYALSEAAGYLGERVKQRQEATADNQQFDNTLMAAGNNDKERARIKEAYIQNSQEFGMKIDRESAVAYSNMVQGFRAQGKTLEEAIQLQKDQAAVFRIGNLDKAQQYSAALQLNQGYSKDRFLGQDLRPLTDALGTRLTTILYQAIGKALGYKGDVNKLAGFVLEAQHDGKVNGAMVQQGMRDIVAQSPELLERHKHSLDAQAVRVENDKYLQSEKTNADPTLIAALGERLTAERELIESTNYLQVALRNFDLGLVKVETHMLRMFAGKNADGSDKSEQQKLQDRMSTSDVAVDTNMVGVGDYSKIDAGTQHQGGWIGELYNKLFSVKDYRASTPESRDTWKDVGFDQEHAPWSITPPALDLSRLNTKGLPDFNKHLEQLLSQSDPSNAVARLAAGAAATASRAAPGSRGEWVSDEPPVRGGGGTVVNNTTNATNTTPTSVTNNVTVNVKTDADANEIAKVVTDKIFGEYLPKETK
ncbi:coiled-coil domain-containing protein [Pseudomonas marginalis]|uniref:hypothetical protein n=1 Tax=Pseudomonas marginalis TaxID=298 RepID=UPI0011B450D3|nr:hypothetical protein [Pseudomonas marginalis]KAA8552164.1 hypothetical protein FX984_04675 [Pseudomonas marginalis]TWR74114.1 hypothetical protein FIV40_01765 [Pseudomonas marginalis]